MAEKEYIERGTLIDYLTKPTGQKATCDGCCDIDCVDCIRDEVIKNLPVADVVTRGTLEQFIWERDMALLTLKEHGIGFAQKADKPNENRGCWEVYVSEDGYEHHRCSSCGKDAIFDYVTEPMYDEGYDGEWSYVADIETGISEHITDFCPSCGAKMDGDKNAE